MYVFYMKGTERSNQNIMIDQTTQEFNFVNDRVDLIENEFYSKIIIKMHRKEIIVDNFNLSLG